MKSQIATPLLLDPKAEVRSGVKGGERIIFRMAMTTPFERTNALVAAGELLESLRTAESGAVSANIREQTRHILRHYPSNSEIGWLTPAGAAKTLWLCLIRMPSPPRCAKDTAGNY